MSISLSAGAVGAVFERRFSSGVILRGNRATYAELRSAEAAAEAVISAAVRRLEGVEDNDIVLREMKAARGAADAAYADELADCCLMSWEGVEDAAGERASPTPGNWRVFRDVAPRWAELFITDIVSEARGLESEGNASAASPNGAGEAA